MSTPRQRPVVISRDLLFRLIDILSTVREFESPMDWEDREDECGHNPECDSPLDHVVCVALEDLGKAARK